MYLVDTSVWIDFFRARPTAAVERLRGLVQAGADFGISPQILQEILQGARDEAQFAKYHAYLSTQRIHRFDDPVIGAVAAARLYFDCRRQGIIVRSSNDCLIAQCALEHGLTLLHDDRDFEHIARINANLKQTSG